MKLDEIDLTDLRKSDANSAWRDYNANRLLFQKRYLP